MIKIMAIIQRLIFCLILFVLGSDLSAQSCVTFDDSFAPLTFVQQLNPASDYSDGFVTFGGGSWEVLDVTTFSITGQSMPNALKWNTNASTSNTESILFMSPVENVSFNIGATTNYTVVDAYIEAFDAAGTSLGVINMNIVSTSLIPINFPFPNISRIDLTITDDPISGGSAGCLDDLCYTFSSFEEIPTMGQWGLICLSLLLMIVGITSISQRKEFVLRS